MAGIRKKRGHVPMWQDALPGLCVNGKCTNPQCEAAGEMVIVSYGFTRDTMDGVFDLEKHSPSLTCPMCPQHVQPPITFAFESCEWKYCGESLTWMEGAKEIPESEWLRADDKDAYSAFVESTQTGKMLTQLKIATRPIETATRPHANPVMYSMRKNPHGICLILNNFQFHSGAVRLGATVDQDNLKQTFKRMRYLVDIRENLSSDDMSHTLEEYSRSTHSDYDSFVCCIMSHGGKGSVLGADDQEVAVTNLIEKMQKCPTLVGKPKMFFIQACRGSNRSNGMALPPQTDSLEDSATVAEESDVFIAYATPEGKVAYRDSQEGSWFIRELCSVFNDFAHESNLSTMMEKVNDNISKVKSQKQCTETTSRLRKGVRFC